MVLSWSTKAHTLALDQKQDHVPYRKCPKLVWRWQLNGCRSESRPRKSSLDFCRSQALCVQFHDDPVGKRRNVHGVLSSSPPPHFWQFDFYPTLSTPTLAAFWVQSAWFIDIAKLASYIIFTHPLIFPIVHIRGCQIFNILMLPPSFDF